MPHMYVSKLPFNNSDGKGGIKRGGTQIGDEIGNIIAGGTNINEKDWWHCWENKVDVFWEEER